MYVLVCSNLKKIHREIIPTQEIWPTESIMDGPKSQFRKDEKSIDN